jgi:hypothetical protein
MKSKLRIAIVVVCAAAILAPAQTQAIPEGEKEAIIRTALDYGDGFYSGAAERMERALHPDLNKVYVTTLPQTGKSVLNYSTFSGLIEMTRAKVGLTDPEKRKIQGYALHLNGDIACAKITSAQYNDFLQMVKIDGQWKIVNVLWVPVPDFPNRPKVPSYDPAKDDQAILAAAGDYIEGTMAGDAARVEKALHPEASRAVLLSMPTGKIAINRARYSSLVEPVRAKLTLVPDGSRKAETKIIDVMDGMAFVEIATANSWHYLQMTLIDGQWKIINILSKRIAAAPKLPRP